MVWNANNGVPGTLLAEQTVPVKRNGNNLFTYYRFNPSVIVPDTFFIGWKQAPGGLIRIGLDSSNDTGNFMFVNTTGTWIQNDLVTGSLMIRPQFGKGEIVTGTESATQQTIALYPNPNNGNFYLTGEPTAVEVITLTGQTIPYQIQRLGNLLEINTHIVVPGIYLVRCQTSRGVQVIKMMVKP
jgi:hypothetical protein